jgi:hypothetical protein
MSLQKWLEYGWLRPHQPSRKEISDLLRIIDRDLHDAAGNISADWRFGIAYNAALKLCTILLYAEGYRRALDLLNAMNAPLDEREPEDESAKKFF